jgi:shikimate kinase
LEGLGESHGALTVVNAVATGRGAALGVDLKVKARVYLKKLGSADTSQRRDLVGVVCKQVLDYLGIKDLSASSDVSTQVPASVGMKSSSSVANALILALADALDADLSAREVLKLNVESSRRAGVTYTGALDDAAACLLGGVQVTDNHNDKIVCSYCAKIEKVVFLVPYGLARPDIRSRIDSSLRENATTAYSLALRRRYHDAVNLNGSIYGAALGYPSEPAVTALRNGATAAGLTGNGPAYAALVSPNNLNDVVEAWSELGRTIVTDVYNGALE